MEELIKEIREKINNLKKIAGDPEAAHIEEDNIWHIVLRHVADGHQTRHGAAELAKMALETDEIKFDRWYA